MFILEFLYPITGKWVQFWHTRDGSDAAAYLQTAVEQDASKEYRMTYKPYENCGDFEKLACHKLTVFC